MRQLFVAEDWPRWDWSSCASRSEGGTDTKKSPKDYRKPEQKTTNKKGVQARNESGASEFCKAFYAQTVLSELLQAANGYAW